MSTASSGCLLLVALAFTFVIAHSQSQTGFISIDCGASQDYADDSTGLYYTTDEPYIKSGVNYEVQSMYKASAVRETQFNNVRSFPNGTRNCYTLKPPLDKNGTNYLIRARFMYGNYDSKNALPQFDLYLGVNLWTNISISDAETAVSKELVQVITSNVIYICLVNTGLGTPFISALELRPLVLDAYKSPYALALFARLDFGNEDKFFRFPDDIYDRIWKPYRWSTFMNTLKTNLTFDVGVTEDWLLTPQAVMSTAVTPKDAAEPIEFFWELPDPKSKCYSFMHFGEVEKLEANQTREFVIKLNGVTTASAIKPDYLYSSRVYDYKPMTRERFNYSIERTTNSTLPPIINALEVFIVKDFLQSETDQGDVGAIRNIQKAYGLVRDWVADPCAPQNHTWDGLNCSFNGYEPPRITSLNLSSGGLTGKISEHIQGLKLLEHLDFSNNNLSGPVPAFLSEMSSLVFLNLSGNNLSGTIPTELINRAQQGSLMLSAERNPNLCSANSCTSTTKTDTAKKSSALILIIAAVSTVVLLLLVFGTVVFWRAKAKPRKDVMRLGSKKDMMGQESKNVSAWSYTSTSESNSSESQSYERKPSLSLIARNRRFSFTDVQSMTNNLERLLGQGGFGKVYYGQLGDKTEVAVKVLNPSLSREGYNQFHTEAEILLKVHHTNLASMIGYCHEEEHLCVIYELMANGDLEDYLNPAKNPNFPSWEERLQIALDAAQGLEYLHHGCKSPIVHRDVKSTNILLTEKLQARVADFGISKIFPDDKVTHVLTSMKGTPGYLDPEFFNCMFLNEKSDVYAFGVVLFEIITGQHAIVDMGEGKRENITSWVSNIIATKGDVRTAVDSRLQRNFDVNSAWKLVETATACVSAPSSQRPTMNHVVIEIKQCLDMEKARKNRGHQGINSSGSSGHGHAMLPNMNATSGPVAR